MATPSFWPDDPALALGRRVTGATPKMTQGQTARRPTRGVRNNNPGNIRRVSGVTWQGQAKDQTGAEFVVYVSPEMGVRALVRTLLTYNKAHKLGVEAGKILAPLLARRRPCWSPSPTG